MIDKVSLSLALARAASGAGVPDDVGAAGVDGLVGGAGAALSQPVMAGIGAVALGDVFEEKFSLLEDKGPRMEEKSDSERKAIHEVAVHQHLARTIAYDRGLLSAKRLHVLGEAERDLTLLPGQLFTLADQISHNGISYRVVRMPMEEVGYYLVPELPTQEGHYDIKLLFRGTKDWRDITADMDPCAPGYRSFGRARFRVMRDLNVIIKQVLSHHAYAAIMAPDSVYGLDAGAGAGAASAGAGVVDSCPAASIGVTVVGHSLGGSNSEHCYAAIVEAMRSNQAFKAQVDDGLSDDEAQRDKGVRHRVEKLKNSASQRDSLSHIKNVNGYVFNSPGTAARSNQLVREYVQDLSRRDGTVFELTHVKVAGDFLQQLGQESLGHGIASDVMSVNVVKIHVGQEGLGTMRSTKNAHCLKLYDGELAPANGWSPRYVDGELQYTKAAIALVRVVEGKIHVQYFDNKTYPEYVNNTTSRKYWLAHHWAADIFLKNPLSYITSLVDWLSVRRSAQSQVRFGSNIEAGRGGELVLHRDRHLAFLNWVIVNEPELLDGMPEIQNIVGGVVQLAQAHPSRSLTNMGALAFAAAIIRRDMRVSREAGLVSLGVVSAPELIDGLQLVGRLLKAPLGPIQGALEATSGFILAEQQGDRENYPLIEAGALVLARPSASTTLATFVRPRDAMATAIIAAPSQSEGLGSSLIIDLNQEGLDAAGVVGAIRSGFSQRPLGLYVYGDRLIVSNISSVPELIDSLAVSADPVLSHLGLTVKGRGDEVSPIASVPHDMISTLMSAPTPAEQNAADTTTAVPQSDRAADVRNQAKEAPKAPAHLKSAVLSRPIQLRLTDLTFRQKFTRAFMRYTTHQDYANKASALIDLSLWVVGMFTYVFAFSYLVTRAAYVAALPTAQAVLVGSVGLVVSVGAIAVATMLVYGAVMGVAAFTKACFGSNFWLDEEHVDVPDGKPPAPVDTSSLSRDKTGLKSHSFVLNSKHDVQHDEEVAERSSTQLGS